MTPEDQITELRSEIAALRATIERYVPAARHDSEERERVARRARFAAVTSVADWLALSRNDRAAFSTTHAHLIAMVKDATPDQREMFLASRPFLSRAAIHHDLCAAPTFVRVTSQNRVYQMGPLDLNTEQATALREAGARVDEDADHRCSIRGLWLSANENVVYPAREWFARIRVDERLRAEVGCGHLTVTNVDESEARSIALRAFVTRYESRRDVMTNGGACVAPEQLPEIL